MIYFSLYVCMQTETVALNAGQISISYLKF